MTCLVFVGLPGHFFKEDNQLHWNGTNGAEENAAEWSTKINEMKNIDLTQLAYYFSFFYCCVKTVEPCLQSVKFPVYISISIYHIPYSK